METPIIKAKITFISKKKFIAFKEFINTQLDSETSEEFLTKFCEIMDYDPDASTYDKLKGISNDKWRKKKAIELGVSLHQISKGIKNLKVNQ